MGPGQHNPDRSEGPRRAGNRSYGGAYISASSLTQRRVKVAAEGTKGDGKPVRWVGCVCNECGAVAATITTAQLEAGYVPEELRSEEVATAQCPHCGAMNAFPGFRAIEAFVCRECGEGVSIEHPIQ